MQDRTCSDCGATISRGRRCERCKWKSRPRIPCSDCGLPTGWPQSSSAKAGPNPRCRACSRAKCGSTAAYKNGCRCSECRAAVAASANRQRRRYVAKHGVPPELRYRKNKDLGYSCAECGASVRGTGSAGKAADGLILCSEHRDAKRERDRARMRKRANFRKAIERAAEGTSGNPNWPFFQGSCRECGESFVRQGVPTPYCSPECNPRRRGNRREYRGWIRQSVRLSIYERDSWTCQLCLEPVDRDAITGDWMPTLDHVVPRSKGGSDDPSNLRCCHAWCNSVRGDGTFNADFFDGAVVRGVAV